MAVLRLKPHRLAYWKDTDGYIDENGDNHEGSHELIDYCDCDVVPATGEAKTIVFDDGVADTYSYVIYLPKHCRRFERGDKIVLKRCCDEKTFTVKGFQRYQLQCKLWV